MRFGTVRDRARMGSLGMRTGCRIGMHWQRCRREAYLRNDCGGDQRSANDDVRAGADSRRTQGIIADSIC